MYLVFDTGHIWPSRVLESSLFRKIIIHNAVTSSACRVRLEVDVDKKVLLMRFQLW